MRPAYYNEIDAYAAQWLRNLIAAGHLPAGDVDTRSIVDVRADDLAGYGQCHFFAGIGGWPLAARLAGWPDDRELWTGSAPCQPFSVAGQGKAQADDRHLWPHLFRLASARRPAVLMGEQVAAAVGKDWLDGVFADLEGIGYACGAAVVPACAVDAPHRRDRLWFVADASSGRRGEPGAREVEQPRRAEAVGAGDGDVGHAVSAGLEGFAGHGDRAAGREEPDLSAADAGCGGGAVADAGSERRIGWPGIEGSGRDTPERSEAVHHAGDGCASRPVADAHGERGQVDSHTGGCAPGSGAREVAGPGGAWHGAGWIIGHDGKARRVEPGIRLLAHGVPARVGRLRAYGNAIVPQVAAEVIGAYLDMEAEEWGDQPLEAAA